jgi:uncharacterized protein YbbK (DUF523 family)
VQPLWHDESTIRVGISSCLLGAEVRWDGGHKRDRFLTDELAPYVEWVAVCPEVEIAHGTPRSDPAGRAGRQHPRRRISGAD